MPKSALSEARIKALRSRRRAYDFRDARFKGFGERVLPSGANRFFIHTQHRRHRVWKIVGDLRFEQFGALRPIPKDCGASISKC